MAVRILVYVPIVILLSMFFKLTKCGIFKNNSDSESGRIVGGEIARLEDFPFMVHFFNSGGMCAGSILTKSIVLTAAHCFQFNKDPLDMQVFSGAREVYDTLAVSHDIMTYVIHEDFDVPEKFSNDIALILIADEFEYGPIVRKSKLANSDDWMKTNAEVTVAGWGNTKEHEVAGLNTKFLKTYLNYAPQKVCEETNHVKLGPDMICLYGGGKRDACQGDSGAPVLYKSLIVGIVSHGIGCARHPSMYTNVYYFRPWIQETAEDLQRRYCSGKRERGKK